MSPITLTMGALGFILRQNIGSNESLQEYVRYHNLFGHV